MAYLLDTHVILWFLNGDKQLSTTSRKKIMDVNNACFISIASIWEIAIKSSIGKLDLDFNLKEMSDYLSQSMIAVLPLTFNHILQLTGLELIHRDPFDRIIVAQAIEEKMILVSKDPIIHKYPLKTLW